MSRIRTLTIAMMAVCALGIAATSIASAHEFNNRGAESRIVGTADATQTFITAAGRIECKKLEAISGKAPAGVTASLLVILIFISCDAYGLRATVTEIWLLLDASGEVKVEKPIIIKATGCETVIPEQTVKTVNYANQGTKAIKITPEITGIISEGKGTACTYAKESKGTFTGASLLSLENGAELELMWVGAQRRWPTNPGFWVGQTISRKLATTCATMLALDAPQMALATQGVPSLTTARFAKTATTRSSPRSRQSTLPKADQATKPLPTKPA